MIERKRKVKKEQCALFVSWLFLVSWLLCLNSLSAPFCLSSHLNPPPSPRYMFPRNLVCLLHLCPFLLLSISIPINLFMSPLPSPLSFIRY